MDLTSLMQLGINGPPPPPEDEDKKKRVDNILSELGLHPAQVETRKSLGIRQPTEDISSAPEVKNSPLIENPKIETHAVVPETSTRVSAPTPVRGALFQSPDSQISNSRDSVLNSQKEAARLVRTGSGISQIHNPFLRGVARAGDIALSSLFPAIAMNIPGTELHHDRLYQAEQNNISHGLRQEDIGAQVYDRLDPSEGKNPTALSMWVEQNPNGKIQEFWKEQAAAQGVGKTPEELLYNYLVTEGKLDPKTAYTTVQDIKNKEKPDNASQHKQEMEALIQKVLPDMNPQDLSDVRTLGESIKKSPYGTPAEKAQLMSWYAMNSSPASQGMAGNIRGEHLEQARISTYLDTQTGQLQSMNAEEFNNANAKEPGRYVDSKSASPALQKEAIFKDIYFNIDNVRDAMAAMVAKGVGFTMAQRAQMALMLRNSDPKSALGPFFNSEVGKTLEPEQADYVTALASMQENALALRGIAGFGTGSDELRAAILKTLPGAGTPNLEYANRQMDLFKGTVDRLHTGVPQLKSSGSSTNTGEGTKTLTKAQVQAAAASAGISYDEAKKGAEAEGYQVKE